MSALKLLAAIALVISPASLGIAAYTGAVDLDLTASSEPGFNGKIVHEETGSFDEPVTEGTLDLRVDRGAVRVIGWEKPEYRVIVVEEPHEDAALSDQETSVEFEDRSSGSTIDLKVVADRQGTYRVQQDGDGVRTGDHVDLAIVAWVPASAQYSTIRACSGQDSFWSGAISTADDVLGEIAEVRDGDHGCVPAQETPSTMGQISINHEGNSTGLNVTSGVVGLQGDALRALTSYGSIEVTEAGFETIDLDSAYGEVALADVTAGSVEVSTDYGAITARELEVTDLELASGYGDLTVQGTAEAAEIATEYGSILLEGTFDDLDVSTEYGDLAAELAVRASGAYDLSTEYGNVELSVPARDAIGYDVVASTEYGDVDVDLQDASRQGDAGEEDDEDREREHVRTDGFDERAIQVEMVIETEYGDVDVGHQALDPEEEEESTAASDPDPGETGPVVEDLAVPTSDVR